jgi:hypothetical protein
MTVNSTPDVNRPRMSGDGRHLPGDVRGPLHRSRITTSFERGISRFVTIVTAGALNLF